MAGLLGGVTLRMSESDSDPALALSRSLHRHLILQRWWNEDVSYKDSDQCDAVRPISHLVSVYPINCDRKLPPSS